jgi:DNA-directed RNA polymerase subunit RPC12/RpoP
MRMGERMTLFKCNQCGLIMSFDEEETEIIECWDSCGGEMLFYSREDNEDV